MTAALLIIQTYSGSHFSLQNISVKFDERHEYLTKKDKQQHRCKKDDVVQTKAYICIITESETNRILFSKTTHKLITLSRDPSNDKTNKGTP